MSDTESEHRTRTQTREVVETQTVEETDYWCPNCEQWYDEDEIVLVGIGPTKANEDAVEFTWDAAKMDQVCQHCSENIWEYDGYTGIPSEISYELDHWTWREMLSAGASVAVAISPIAVLLGVALIAFRGLNAVMEVSTAATSQATGLVSLMVETLPLLAFLFILIAIWSRVGPGRM